MPRRHPLSEHVTDVPDFPKPGILFRDIGPLLRDHFSATLDALEAELTSAEWAEVDHIAGVESRGFILGAALAARRNEGFVPVRKQGKLPPPVVDVAYDLEYGSGVLEVQRGAGRVLVVDDVLATGGTLRATGDLLVGASYGVLGFLVLIDLRLAGEFTWSNLPARSVIRYD